MLLYLYFFITGTALGSFISCLSYRLIHQESLFKARSVCDHCGHKLGIKDLIPVVSYLLNKGKCTYCGEKIDISYPACELLCGIITCFLYHIYGSSLHFLETEILYLIMLGISLCDLEAFAVPDLYIFLGIMNRIIFLYLDGASMNNYLMCLRRGLSAGIPILVVTAIISFMTGQEVMGAGDIELFILFGSYLSVYENALAVFISCVCGILMYSLFYRRKGELPFCPCICIAYFALIIFRL
ncbi:MAG: prepilin peptidase [Erysipelotrichaceae bacterium]|nr:prepilin peptidase [Erysipelotrichaceae bacterium]